MPVKPRLLVISEFWPPDPGGMATYAHQLIPLLGELGHEVTLLIPDNRTERLPLNSENVTGHIFFSPKLHAIARLSILPAMLRHVKFSEIDVIVDISVAPYAGVSTWLSKRLHIPNVIGAHGNEITRLYPEGGMTKTFRNYCLYTLRNASAIVPNSFFTKSYLPDLSVPTERVHVIHCGVDTTFFCPTASDSTFERTGIASDGRLHVVCAGQLKPMKGQEFLIRALPKLCEKYPNILLDLAGAGVSETHYRELVRELQLEKTVTFHGNVPREKLRELYRNAALSVQPTQRDLIHIEGFGLTAAESLACECPVAASNFGGHTEFVIAGETGELFEANRPSDIAETIGKMLSNPGQLREFGKRGRQLIEQHFTWKQAAKKWSELLCSLSKK